MKTIDYTFPSEIKSFKGIEVSPCQEIEGGVEVVQDESEAQFWGVYFRGTDDLAFHIADFATKAQAESFSNLAKMMFFLCGRDDWFKQYPLGTPKTYSVEELLDIDKADQHDEEVIRLSDLDDNQRQYLGLPARDPDKDQKIVPLDILTILDIRAKSVSNDTREHLIECYSECRDSIHGEHLVDVAAANEGDDFPDNPLYKREIAQLAELADKHKATYVRFTD